MNKNRVGSERNGTERNGTERIQYRITWKAKFQ